MEFEVVRDPVAVFWRRVIGGERGQYKQEQRRADEQPQRLHGFIPCCSDKRNPHRPRRTQLLQKRAAAICATSPLASTSTKYRNPLESCLCAEVINFAQTQTPDLLSVYLCRIYVQNMDMIYGYARVSTDGQSVD